MKRTLINLIVDLSAAVLLLGMIATGFVLRFPLPPGTNKSHALWGLTRHCWGTIHFWVSAALLGVLLLHIVLHWQWLVSVIAKRFGRTAPARSHSFEIALATIIVVVAVSGVFVWATYRSVKPIAEAKLFGVCPAPDHDETGSARQIANERPRTAQVDFARDISPILQRSCLSCHGPQRAAAGFRVDRRQDFFAETNGGPLIVRGKSSDSPLVEVISGNRKGMRLANRHKLPAADVNLFKRWIDAGAQWNE